MSEETTTQPAPISSDQMQSVFEEVKTPFKHGIIIRGGADTMVDCPSVYRFNNRWLMMYVAITGKVGYETFLAESDNLVEWKTLGKMLTHRQSGWDHWQCDGGIALVDHQWEGTHGPQSFDGKYWMSYIGGALQGYEPDPLSIGIAWAKSADQSTEWTRLENNPVLGPSDADVRPFEARTLYKSQIIWDKDETLKHPFVMFYNGKQDGRQAIERIGMAVSHDMKRWSRLGDGPVIDNLTGISGDPQIVRIGDLWVMFYFGHVWQPKAFDTFAVSTDLVNWTKWQGEHLIEPSETWDKTFAHKPWVLKHEGVVYHYYCAVGDEGRCIALATSKRV